MGVLVIMYKQPPEGPSTEGPSAQETMVRLFTTAATIKNKHFSREELIVMENHIFLATVADGQTAAS